MKTAYILTGIMVLAGALVLSACNRGDRSEKPAVREAVNTPREVVNPARDVVITADDAMQFSITAFTVKPGTEVRLTLRNVGTLPKVAMGHNLVLLSMGTDSDIFAEASRNHPDHEYIDPSVRHQVIVGTKMLGPGEEQTLTFKAPNVKGEYPYLCTFPGHALAGMRGVMTVE